jgi:myo-inositol-1(or 4)-monophosphatase
VTAALVYQPVTDESFWAEKSRGAWLQDARLRVSARRQLGEALIATGIPYRAHGDFSEWTRIFAAVGPQVAGIRRFGSAALDLAWVAAGRYDGFWESGLQAWDTAAGCLLVREAGGFVTDYRGRSEPICAAQVVAGNDQLHSRLHKLVVAALKD